jgi:glycerate-2-kinase
MLLFSLSLFGMPMSGLHLSQMQALNRELGKLCSDPPRKAMNVCRLHAQLVRSL